MRPRSSVLLLLLTLIAATAPARGALPAPEILDALSTGTFVPGSVLVRFRDGTTSTEREDALAAVDGVVERRMRRIGWRVVAIDPTSDVEAAVARLRGHRAVESAEPNMRGFATLVPNDRCYAGCNGYKQWSIPAVNAPLGWDVAPQRFFTAAEKKELAPFRIAILDSKIDTSMADWTNPGTGVIADPADSRNGGQLDLLHAKDYIAPERQTGQMAWHGTFIGGIAAASAGNQIDIAGLGYRTEIIPITVLDGAGRTDAGVLAEAIGYAVETGVRVINLSLGLTGDSLAVRAAINDATAAGALVVAAAGNNNDDKPFYPAWMDNVMSVAASDQSDRAGLCSNHNARVSVAAPGVDVVSLDPSATTKLSTRCGTSAATPLVSALAALLFVQDPGRTPAEVRSIIEDAADDDRLRTGRDDYMGRGRINVERALRWGSAVPQVSAAIASIPPAAGPASVLTATATAPQGRTVRAVEYFVDEAGAAGTGARVDAIDGTFDERVEELRGEIPVGLNVPTTGVHRLFVRAFDGAGWGPAASVPLVIDRRAPKIEDLKTEPLVVSTAGSAVRVTFRVSDDWSNRLTFSLTVSRRLPATEPVYDSGTRWMVPGNETFVWQPGVDDRGPHDIKLTIRDEAGNPVSATTSTIVL